MCDLKSIRVTRFQKLFSIIFHEDKWQIFASYIYKATFSLLCFLWNTRRKYLYFSGVFMWIISSKLIPMGYSLLTTDVLKTDQCQTPIKKLSNIAVNTGMFRLWP